MLTGFHMCTDISGVFASPATPARKVIVTQERIIDISGTVFSYFWYTCALTFPSVRLA